MGGELEFSSQSDGKSASVSWGQRELSAVWRIRKGDRLNYIGFVTGWASMQGKKVLN